MAPSRRSEDPMPPASIDEAGRTARTIGWLAVVCGIIIAIVALSDLRHPESILGLLAAALAFAVAGANAIGRFARWRIVVPVVVVLAASSITVLGVTGLPRDESPVPVVDHTGPVPTSPGSPHMSVPA